MNEVDFFDFTFPFNLEHELGSEYINTKYSFDGHTGCYRMESEILDKSQHAVGNLAVDCYVNHFYQDTENIDFEFCMKVGFKGDTSKINSLLKSI